jgi:hypothetical protein
MQVTATSHVITVTMSWDELETLKTALSIYASRMRQQSKHIEIGKDRFYCMEQASNANTMLLAATNPTYTD